MRRTIAYYAFCFKALKLELALRTAIRILIKCYLMGMKGIGECLNVLKLLLLNSDLNHEECDATVDTVVLPSPDQKLPTLLINRNLH